MLYNFTILKYQDCFYSFDFDARKSIKVYRYVDKDYYKIIDVYSKYYTEYLPKLSITLYI